MKRLLLPLLVLLAAAACSPKTAPAGSGSRAGKAASDIVILYDNDVHCAVDGYAEMAALKAVMGLDEETRRLTLSAIRILYQSLMRSLPDSPLKMLEDRLSFLNSGGKDPESNNA